MGRSKWGLDACLVTQITREELIRFVALIAGLQALVYMMAYLLKGVFSFMTRQTIIVMSQAHRVRPQGGSIYDQYQKLPLSAFYKQNATGDLMNRISEDVSKVRMYLGPCRDVWPDPGDHDVPHGGCDAPHRRPVLTLWSLAPLALDELGGVPSQRAHPPEERRRAKAAEPVERQGPAGLFRAYA